MVILLTAPPHTGKSTILHKVIEQFSRPKYGVTVRGIIDDPLTDHRSAFAAVRIDGQERIIAQREFIEGAPKIGNWYVDLTAIDNFVVPAITEALTHSEGLIILEEIAKIEMASKKFAELCKKLLHCDNLVLGAIAQDNETWALPYKTSHNIILFPVTLENRANLPQILTEIFEALLVYRPHLTPKQICLLRELTREYATQNMLIQLGKLFKHALPYIVENKIHKEKKACHYTVFGNHGSYHTFFDPADIKSATCTCDLYLGRGRYTSHFGVCSHIQAAMLIQ